MIDLRSHNIAGPAQNEEVGPPNIAKPGKPTLTCRWQKASDGALVMVWSVVEATVPTLRVVTSNPNPPLRLESSSNEKLAAPSRPIRRMKSAVERAAIAVLLGASGFLTWMSFVVEHNDLL
jgi:hypothetical protein